MGLGSLAAVLEESDVDVEIINLADCKDLNKVEFPESDWYGISCVSATLNATKEIVSKINGKTVVGGVHPTVLPEETKNKIKPDVVMTGEAEYLLRDLITGKVKPEPIMKAGLIQDLDSLPFPARHLFDRKDVVDYTGIHGQEKGVPATTVITSRGCPYVCAFCCRDHPMFTTYRYRNSENVRGELQTLKEEYGIEHVRFVDDEFTLNKERTSVLMDNISDLGLTWVCITRADTLDVPLLKKMRNAGCTEVHIGVETGSSSLLRAMNKKTTPLVLLKGVKMIKEAGIRVKTYLMMNFPRETEEDRQFTIDWMKKARPDKFTLSVFTPLPGSATSKYLEQDGDGWFYKDEDEDFLEYREQLREAAQC